MHTLVTYTQAHTQAHTHTRYIHTGTHRHTLVTCTQAHTGTHSLHAHRHTHTPQCLSPPQHQRPFPVGSLAACLPPPLPPQPSFSPPLSQTNNPLPALGQMWRHLHGHRFKCHSKQSQMSQQTNSNVTANKFKCHSKQIQMSQQTDSNVTANKFKCHSKQIQMSQQTDSNVTANRFKCHSKQIQMSQQCHAPEQEP